GKRLPTPLIQPSSSLAVLARSPSFGIPRRQFPVDVPYRGLSRLSRRLMGGCRKKAPPGHDGPKNGGSHRVLPQRSSAAAAGGAFRVGSCPLFWVNLCEIGSSVPPSSGSSPPHRRTRGTSTKSPVQSIA